MGIVKVFFKTDCPMCPGAKKLSAGLKAKNVTVVDYNVDTPDGLAEASFYGILSLPAVIIEDASEKGIKEWRGTVPPLDEVFQIVAAV
jgi:hypothetical protein